MLNIYYIANTGFLIENNGKKVMIDAIHTRQVDPYYSVDTNTIQKMIKGDPPFDHLDLLLFTHYHWDHLDGEVALKVLKNQPNTKLFSNRQTIEHLKALTNYDISLEKQLLSSEVTMNTIKDFSINGIDFSVASLKHDGTEYDDVINFSYLIQFGSEILYHCGDAKADLSNYENLGLEKLHIKYALLDFPYITLPSARKVVKNHIKPEKILLMHMPSREKDKYNWLKSIHKVIDRYGNDLPELILCEEAGRMVEND